MPIYEQTYRKYEAREPLRTLRFWPITREALRLILAKRAFLGLLALTWLPFIRWVIQIYIVTRFPDVRRLLPVDGRVFGEFLNGQIGLILILTIFGGAGLIANDLRTGAILVYLSRPLTQRDYIFGKLGVLLLLNLSATLAPGLLLYLVALFLAPEHFLKLSLGWVAPAIVVHSLIISLVLSLVALAISSLSRSGRVAGLSFVALILGLEMVRVVLRRIIDSKEATLLSLQGDLKALGNLLFGLVARGVEVDWWSAAMVLVFLSLGCWALLSSRVRAVEVVR